jgi:hypothetical protein
MRPSVCTGGLHGPPAAALTCGYAAQVPQSHIPVALFDLALAGFRIGVSRPVLPHRGGVPAAVQDAERLDVLGAGPVAVAAAQPWLLAGHGRDMPPSGCRSRW